MLTICHESKETPGTPFGSKSNSSLSQPNPTQSTFGPGSRPPRSVAMAPLLLGYLAFALTLFARTLYLLSVSSGSELPDHPSLPPLPKSIPALVPRQPLPMRRADEPTAPLVRQFALLSSAYPVTECADFANADVSSPCAHGGAQGKEKAMSSNPHATAYIERL